MNRADVIVIGGGIAGIGVAARLAADRSVLLLEAETQLGYHATGRSAAIFIRNYGNATLRALNAASVPALEAPSDGGDSLLSSRGELLVATEEELPALEDYAAGATGLQHLSAAEAVELVPILRPERIAGAVIEWAAQDIDVDRMLAGFLRRFRADGGRVVTGARAQALRRDGDLWQIHAGAEDFTAPLLVNAAGAWAAQIGHMAGALPVPLQPMRRSAAILPAPSGHDIRNWPLFVSASEQWYAKPEAGKLMVSPADEDPLEPQDAWADDMVLAEGLHRYEQAVTVPVTRVERTWAGLRTFAADRTPVVGFDHRAQGFFWLAGQGGYGVQTAPALSELAAALIRDDPAGLPDAVVAALRPERFQT